MAAIKHDIRDLSFVELKTYIASMNEQLFRADQIFEWIYKKGVQSFKEMLNLPLALRQRLQHDFIFRKQVVAQKQSSSDGTTKFLFDLDDHEKIETVFIPSLKRSTVCVSTQAGCKFGCRFCASGIGGWKRNLSVAEILGQILYVKKEAQKHNKQLTHVVFMGTGENFDTYDHLMKAIRIMNDKKGMRIGARRITISTVGIIPKIKQLAQENLQVELAISLHGFNNESRNRLMPVNRKYPFVDLVQACREYIRLTKRQVTFEYILIKDVTCTDQAVQELGKYLDGMICKMNLIPYNPVKEFPHQAPTRQEMVSFRNRLKEYGIHATIRTPRGQDVSAACGQLRHS